MSTRPNIVVIMADDLSVGTLQAGLQNGWMPHLQAEIIDKGMAFENSFVVDAVCCPSRATFLTGQHSHNHGVVKNGLPDGGVTVLDDSSTLATWLQAGGYRTGLVGKYLNGYGMNQTPLPADDPTYVPPGWTDWQAILTGAPFEYDINDNGILAHHGSQPSDFLTDVLASRAVDFIRESAGQPFFLWVTPGAPHAQGGAPLCVLNYQAAGPYVPAPRHVGIAANLALPQPPNFNEPSVIDKPAWLKTNYPLLTPAQVTCLEQMHRGRVETMMAVDDLIGTVIAALRSAGAVRETVLIFTSDNGFLLGEHRVSKKQSAYEGSIRVPLYIRKIGAPSAPQTAQQLVTNADLTPTILELAGATAGLTQDGRSLVPILADPGLSPWRTGFLIEHALGGDSPIPTYSAIRTAQHLWVEYATGERELYDVTLDPYQIASRHANPAFQAIRDELSQKLAALKTCAGTSCWQ